MTSKVIKGGTMMLRVTGVVTAGLQRSVFEAEAESGQSVAKERYL